MGRVLLAAQYVLLTVRLRRRTGLGTPDPTRPGRSRSSTLAGRKTGPNPSGAVFPLVVLQLLAAEQEPVFAEEMAATVCR